MKLILSNKKHQSLQMSLRQSLLAAIRRSDYPAGSKLPSSRALAAELGIARNTVVLVYEQLIAEGFLVSRDRSGVYVSESVSQTGDTAVLGNEVKGHDEAWWADRSTTASNEDKLFTIPRNWQRYPYPFLEGVFDHSLFPARDWRESIRKSLSLSDIEQWAFDSSQSDDPLLLEQLRTQILPNAGVFAKNDEILMTGGVQQALSLIVSTFVNAPCAVVVEDPCPPQLRALLEIYGAKVISQPIDAEGIVVDSSLQWCDLVIVSPSHQNPTGVTMSESRRQQLIKFASDNDLLIVEIEYEREANYLGRPQPALYGSCRDDRVIYVSSLSRLLAPGLRLGYIVASKSAICRLRTLRQITTNVPALNNQRTAYHFIAQGYYERLLSELYSCFEERWIALRRAVNYYLLPYVEIMPSNGGTVLWLKSLVDIDIQTFLENAAKRGILIEPVEPFYAQVESDRAHFRLGVTGISSDAIKQGINELRYLFEELTSGQLETLSTVRGAKLTGDQIHDVLAGSTMLCPIAYGELCEIDVCVNGSLQGRAGADYADTDTGTWWIDGDYWCRKWSRWAWGDEGRYYVVVEANVFKLFDHDGRLIDRGLLVSSNALSEIDEVDWELATNWTTS